MREGRLVELIILGALAPILMWVERAERFKRLSPLEQNLARASHGAALITFTLLVAFFLYGAQGVFGFIPWLISNPAEAWPAALFFGSLLTYGLVRFVVGVHRCRGARDGLLATRAFFKLVFGFAVGLYLWYLFPWSVIGPSFWGALAVVAVFLIGLWCAITGTVKFLLLTLGGSNALGLVAQQIRQRTAVWVAARRR